MLAIQDDPEVPEHGQDEEANLCINIDFDDNKTLEVNILNVVIFMSNLKMILKTLETIYFLQTKCLSFQKEIDDLKQEKEKLQTLNDISKKIVQSLQDSFFQLELRIKKGFLRFNQKGNLQKPFICKEKMLF